MVVQGAVRQATTAGRLIGLVFILLLVTCFGTLSLLFENAQRARENLIQTYDHLLLTGELFSALQDAETGQRGYLLTRSDAYLIPYREAVDRVPSLLNDLAGSADATDPGRHDRVRRLELLADSKLKELDETIRLAQAGRVQEALALVQTGEGNQAMSEIRQLVHDIDRSSRTVLAERTAAFDRAASIRIAGTVLVVGLLFVVLIAAAVMLRRAFRSVSEAEAVAEATAEQLRISLDSMSQGISVFDAAGNLAIWNYCFVELFAVPDSLQRVGTPYAAFVRHDWADEDGDFLETPEQVQAAPPDTIGRLRPIVYERARKDGRTFELRRTPLPSGGFVVTYADITQRRSTELQLRQAQRLEAVGQLTGGVAHDFNNLLTVIIGNLDLLRQKSADATHRRHLELALTAAERGAGLTRQLLAFARRQPLEPRPLDVNRLLSDLGGFLQRSLGEQIRVETVMSAGLWTVLADPTQLENALLNLALNARDVMPEGGKLTIEAANAILDATYAKNHSEVQAGAYVMIAVTDTGSGMAPDVIARAFEPFFTTKEEGKGSGMGLAQVFGFVKQSGGHVKIYSEVGQGTTIRLYLPRTGRAAVQISRPPEDVSRGHETVLIVEDNADVRSTAATMLRELGYRCVEAADARQALQILADATSGVELVFTDVVLPGGMLGNELAAKAHALNPRLRFLFTSGYTQNAVVHNAKVDDDIAFLSKPYKKAELAQKLREVLDAPAPPAAVPATDAVPETPPQQRTVVVVEDEVLVLWFALDLVSSLGHVPLEATTAAEALALVRDPARRIDAMVTDLRLPDMRGDELVVQARAARPELPVVIASGYGEDCLSALAGLDKIAYVSKPYDPASVRAAFARIGV